MFKKTKLATLAATAVTLASTSAFAQEAAKAAETNKFDVQAAAAVAAGFAIAIAALGGTLGQGRAVTAALESIGRNPGAAPRIQTPMILGLALIESLVLFAFAIAFLLYSKISILSRPCWRRRPSGTRCRGAFCFLVAPGRWAAGGWFGARGWRRPSRSGRSSLARALVG